MGVNRRPAARLAASALRAMSSSHAFIDAIRVCLARDPHARYITLATVERPNRPRAAAIAVPRARTVVFEGFIDDPSGVPALLIKCSSASDKVRNAISPECEVAWWFERSMTQFRPRGTIAFLDGDAFIDRDHPGDARATRDALARARVRTWNNLSLPDRGQFFWSDGAEGEVRDEIPTHFCVGTLRVAEVDALCLADGSRRSWWRENVSSETFERAQGRAPPVRSAREAC